MRRISVYFSLLVLLGIASIFPVTAAREGIKEHLRQATVGFDDVTLTCRVVHANLAELKKIGRDFPKSYEIKSSNVCFKAPDKMKVEGKLGMVKVKMVINGNKKTFQVPSLHYTDTENIKDKPHKRQTEFDMGILTPSIWNDFIVLDADEDKSAAGPVLKFRLVRENSREKNILCWADAKTCKLVKVEKYESDGALKSRYIYSDHQRCNGIWVPGRVEVYNEDGKLAGASVYEKIKVNCGIPESAFK